MESMLIFTYVISVAAALIIGYFITNWYHKINRRVQLQEAQLFLLGKIAEKHGVGNEDILRAYNHANGFKNLDGELKG